MIQISFLLKLHYLKFIKMIQIMQIILALVLLNKSSSVNSDCGFPALPDSTQINIFQKRYEEHSFVQYECDLKNKLLIGNSVIRCFNGKWIEMTPKCGN